MSTPEITLYNNRLCPWANRAHIALLELGLPFTETEIDLLTPREPWYLETINPRGLVPALKYNNNIFIESSIIVQFLVDSHPSHLLPSSTSPSGPATRARIAFFVDTFMNKIVGPFTSIIHSKTSLSTEEIKEKEDTIVKNLEEHVAPLLEGAAPFFGGSERPTLAEVLTASFVLRFYAYGGDEEIGFGKEILERLDKVGRWREWREAVAGLESVRKVWDEERVVRLTKEKFAKKRQAA